MTTIQIGNKEISLTSPVFIIAELSANHNQDFDLAIETIHAIKETGADAVKLQTYTPDTITIDSSNPLFRKTSGLWKGYTLYELYKKAYTPWEWHADLIAEAEKLGLVCFSAPFDLTAVDFLEELETPAYKIASLEITDIPLIDYVSSKGKPMIISTGIATLKDIELAIKTCQKNANNQIILLKCTSAYPARMEDANLKSIKELTSRFNFIVGLSDHTLGFTVPIASVTLGAKVIEKHFILEKSIASPDAEFSLDKTEFKNLVKAIRDTEKALGHTKYMVTETMKKSRKGARSLFAVEHIKKGQQFNKNNIKSIRPGQGLHPKHYPDILGKTATVNIPKGTPLSWDLIA